MEEFEEILKDIYLAKEAITKNAAIATAQNERLVKLDARLNTVLSGLEGTGKEQQKIYAQFMQLNQQQKAQVQEGILGAVKESASIYNAIPHNFKIEDKTRQLGWGILGLIVFLFIGFKWFTFSGLKNENKENARILQNQYEYIQWVQKNHPKASTESYDKFLEKNQ